MAMTVSKLFCYDDQCQESFDDQPSLIAHQFESHGIKQYRCHSSEPTRCLQSFDTSREVQTHVGVHHSGSSFPCYWNVNPGIKCGRVCKGQTALNRHIKLLHLPGEYRCRHEHCLRKHATESRAYDCKGHTEDRFEDLSMSSSLSVEIIWDSTLPTANGAGSGSGLSSHSLTSTVGGGGLSGKENGATQFKAAIERPSSDLDLRYGTETPSFVGKNGNTFANGKPNSASKSSVLTRTLRQDLFPSSAASMVGLDEKSRHAQYGMPSNSTIDVSLEAPLQPNIGAFAEATSSSGGGFPLRGNHSEYGAIHSMLPTPRNSPLNGNVFNYKQGLENVNSNYSQFDPLFLKGATSKFESNPKQQPDLGQHRYGVSRNLEGAFNSNSSALAEPLVPTSYASVGGANHNGPKLSNATLEAKEPTLDTLSFFALPEPAVFNGLSAQIRAMILKRLPVSVKNKYEYYCWSYKLNQVYKERPDVSRFAGKGNGPF